MTIYRVRTGWSGLQGIPYLSTHYFGFLAGSPQQAATAVVNFWGAVDNFLDGTLSWTVEPDVSHIDETTGETVTLTNVTGGTGSGSLGGDIVAPVTQGLIRWRTGVYIGGREIRGRTFVPGLSESNNIDGLPSSASVAGIAAAAGALIADANSELLVWSRTHGTVAAVLGGNVWNQYAVLRSRRL